MLEHYSHIRIDAKRQALDALDDVRRAESNGNGKPANGNEIETIVEVADDLTSQSRHSLLLRGSPPSGKLLIPLNRRDVRVVEGARLESVCRETLPRVRIPLSPPINLFYCSDFAPPSFPVSTMFHDGRATRATPAAVAVSVAAGLRCMYRSVVVRSDVPLVLNRSRRRPPHRQM